MNEIYIGFNENGGTKSFDFLAKLNNGKNYLYSEHMNQQVDIIALSINASFLNNMNAKYHFFPLEKDAYTIAKMKSKGVFEGDLVYSLGYPLNLGNTSQKNPICRLGCISRISNLYIPGNPELNFLVDAQSFPGNSGGPVIIRPEILSVIGSKSQDQTALIGILHKYIPYTDPLISAQTGQTYSIMQENSGLTLVHPVDYILEVVELERNRVGDKNISKYEMVIPNEQPLINEPNQGNNQN